MEGGGGGVQRSILEKELTEGRNEVICYLNYRGTLKGYWGKRKGTYSQGKNF